MTTVDVDREERGLYANADPEELEEELDSGAPTEEPPEPLFGIEDEEAVTE